MKTLKNNVLLIFALTAGLITLSAVAGFAAEKILYSDNKPEVVQALPEVIDPGAVVYEGDFIDIDVSQERVPLYVVKKMFKSGDTYPTKFGIISAMHTNEHAIEIKERYRGSDDVILITLHPEEIAMAKRMFPDRRIVEVMPDPHDTKIRSGRVGPYLLTQANIP